MPSMYPIAAFCFITTYFIEKHLMFNYHQKSSKFNEQMALYSLSLFKYPVILHRLISVLHF